MFAMMGNLMFDRLFMIFSSGFRGFSFPAFASVSLVLFVGIQIFCCLAWDVVDHQLVQISV